MHTNVFLPNPWTLNPFDIIYLIYTYGTKIVTDLCLMIEHSTVLDHLHWIHWTKGSCLRSLSEQFCCIAAISEVDNLYFTLCLVYPKSAQNCVAVFTSSFRCCVKELISKPFTPIFLTVVDIKIHSFFTQTFDEPVLRRNAPYIHMIEFPNSEMKVIVVQALSANNRGT